METNSFSKVIIGFIALAVSASSWAADPKCPSPLSTVLTCKGDKNNQLVNISIYLICKDANSKYSLIGGQEGQAVQPEAETLPVTLSSANGVDSYVYAFDGDSSVTMAVKPNSTEALNSTLTMKQAANEETAKYSCKK